MFFSVYGVQCVKIINRCAKIFLKILAHHNHMFLGIVVLAIGIVFILKALGFISGGIWTLFWGIVFLVAGLKMISKKNHCMHCDWFGFKHEHDHREQ